jgi:hypothetical protein
MASGWLNHKQLLLVKGIGKTAGDSLSAESDPVVISLMSGLITLDSQGWNPEVAQVKNGGIWADSPLNDGRELLAAAVGNVTEKITVLVAATAYLDVMRALSSLNQMANDCRDYWQTEYQIEPVYLTWEAGCGAGPQYALLYNIEVSPEYLDAPSPTMRVSLSLEREPYWRGIPPGANPNMWSYYVNSAHPQFNKNGASLLSGTDHLIVATLQNKHEWTPAAAGLQLTAISKNYIDIAASQVPGDAPALVEIGIEPSSTEINIITSYIGHTTKPFTATGHDGVTRAQALILNAGDSNGAGNIVKTVVTSETGVKSNNSAVNYYNGVRTVTGIDPDWTTSAMWGGTTAFAAVIRPDKEIYRGTFAVFARAFNTSAVSPVVTDMRMRLQIGEGADPSNNMAYVFLPEVQVPLLGSNSDFDLTYLGMFTLPLSERSVSSGLGYGRQIQEVSSNVMFTLQQRVDVATANRTFTLIDLVLMPIDEGLMSVVQNSIAITTQMSLICDNTGYMTRGEGRQVAFSFLRNFSDAYITTGGIANEARGQGITLKPNTAQRLYFINSFFLSGGTRRGLMDNFTVRMNIVPRWAGIRDV